MKKSVTEIRQIAEAAITARYAATDAKKAWEDAGSPDGDLKTAYENAEAAATEAKSQADALSQDDGGDDSKKKKAAEKIKRKMQYLKKDLKDLGVSDDDDDSDEDSGDDDLDDDIDLDKPLTLGDLQRIEAKKAKNAASDMANAIEDPIARQAVKDALKRITPSGDAEQDYRDALAIANASKNSKILEELMRKPTPPQHRSGSGAPARQAKQDDADIEFTAEEKGYLKPPFNLTKEAVIAARKANEAQKR
jgi:hypothetical protein